MANNHTNRRRMCAAFGVLPLLAATCSSGDDGDGADLEILGDTTAVVATSPVTGTAGPSAPGVTTREGSAPTTPGSGSDSAACTPEQADAVGDGFDPVACVSLGALRSPILVDDTVWGQVESRIAAYDASTGAQVFLSDELKGELDSLAVIEVDGQQLVAAMVAAKDPGDAVNAPSEGWQALAWPADAGAAGSSEPVVDILGEGSAYPVDAMNFDAHWGNRGVMVVDQYLRYGAGEFETFTVPEEYEIPESQDPTPPEPFFVGTSQDLLLAYVETVDHNQVSGEPKSFAGFFAVDAGGNELWNHLTSSPAGDFAVGYSGPAHMRAVWGDYALDITMAESGVGGDVTWYDAATGKESAPTPDQLAGANARGFDSVMTTPDGNFLAFSAYYAPEDATRNYILDVTTGTITRVDSENELTPSAMIAMSLYTSPGAVVDLTTGAATALQSGTAPVAVSEAFGVFNAADTVVVAPTD